MLNRCLPWIWYPLTIVGALSLHNIFSIMGNSLIVSTYMPVIFSAFVILLLEKYYPYNEKWKPDKSEIKNELIFKGYI